MSAWSSFRGRARGRGGSSSSNPPPVHQLNNPPRVEQSAPSNSPLNPVGAAGSGAPAPVVVSTPWGRRADTVPVQITPPPVLAAPIMNSSNPWGRSATASAVEPLPRASVAPAQRVVSPPPVAAQPSSNVSTSTPVTYNAISASRSGATTTLVTQLAQTRISDPKLKRPLRQAEKGVVKECSEIGVVANHYGVAISGKFPKEIFHYDVVIEPAMPSESRGAGGEVGLLPDRILPEIWRKFETTYAATLRAATPFDGKKNCYTTRRLTFDGQDSFNVKLKMADPDDPDKMREFRIVMKLVSIVPTNTFWEFLKSGKAGMQVDLPQDIIQALDVALRSAPSIRYYPCNRSFFTSNKPHDLDACLELWYGHYQSLCLGSDEKATLNIDLASKAFFKKMPVTQFLRINLGLSQSDSLDLSEWDSEFMRRANECLKGKLIEYGTGTVVNGKYEKLHKFTAVGLVNDSANSYKFTSSGVEMTIAHYMRTTKGTKIEYPNYPCLHIGSQKMTNYVPLELAFIIPQAYRGKMEPALTKEMIKGAAIGPIDRFQRINISRKGCYYESCKVLEEFGIDVSSTMTKVEKGKRLHPPTITTCSNKQADSRTAVDPKEGKWVYTSRGQSAQRQFLKPANVPKMGILDCVGTDPKKIMEFINTLSGMGEAHGMMGFRAAAQWKDLTRERVQRFSPSLSSRNKFGEEVAQRLEAMKKKGVELVIVIISQDGKEYASVKAEAEVRVGILTACIKSGNVNMIKNQTLTNYLLKLNSKLNGMNWSVGHLDSQFLHEPVIIFGADVTHPAPNSKAPSIAAVTASYNVQGMGYNMHIQPQASRQEVIDRIGTIVDKMLLDYYRKTNQRKPKKLIMFRDGVSEGYFNEIKQKEFREIQEVCERRGGIDNPIKITFVVVKKRHHTRLQPCNKNEGVGRFFNVPPGTVVDTKIVHPVEQEFFLNSHVGIQGTSKPTRYHVIHDDNNFTTSMIQKLTYYLCYSFVRCTQPVSYPAATYYAHLAAYRARHLIEKEGESADFTALQRQLTIHPDLLQKYPMFYV